jgi:predicted TIM-barrel fold metal-dependent hydrolase
MAKHGFRVIDTELHLEEPLDLFETRLEEPYRSMTGVAGPPEGRLKDGGKRFTIGSQTADNSVNESAQLVQKQSARRLRQEPRLLKARTDCRPEVYLEGMDIEGIEVAVLMPTLMLGLSAMDDVDPRHMAALCRVYNNWAYEFTRGDAERFKFWAWVPKHDPRLAADEARRCVEELGAVGAAMPSPAVNGQLLSSEFFCPLWAELQRLNVPIGFHPSSGRTRDDIRTR